MNALLFSGLQKIAGPYMNWEPWGFDIWDNEAKFPITVVTRSGSFHAQKWGIEREEALS